jgi:hypothetical protein
MDISADVTERVEGLFDDFGRHARLSDSVIDLTAAFDRDNVDCPGFVVHDENDTPTSHP